MPGLHVEQNDFSQAGSQQQFIFPGLRLQIHSGLKALDSAGRDPSDVNKPFPRKFNSIQKFPDFPAEIPVAPQDLAWIPTARSSEII
jgi:hypothetical protein